MLTRRTFNLRALALFGWRNALLTTLWATAVWAAYERQGWEWVGIPFLPVATIGTAVAFYIGFKNNSSYERMWEARKIWGAIVNRSRALTIGAAALIAHRKSDADPAAVAAEVQRIAYRQIAWVNTLRLQLRRPSPINATKAELPQIRAAQDAVEGASAFESEVRRHLETVLPSAVCDQAMLQQNVATHLLGLHAEQLADLKRRDWLDGFEHSDLLAHVTHLLDAQGAAERIKTFPFPRQYANFSLIFVVIFIILLPLGLVRELAAMGESYAWMAIPFSLLISWVFYSMEQVGDASENPFENGVNDIPMSAMCRNIEIDLRELLGESDLPERLQPTNGVLL